MKQNPFAIVSQALVLLLVFLFTCSMVQTPEDTRRALFFHNLCEKNRAFLNSENRIPKVFHFIWLGPEDFPEGSVAHLKKWHALHPDWKMQLWTDRERPLPLSCMENRSVRNFNFHKLQDCYDNSDNFGEKSLVLRYEILFQEGGVYLDHDVEPRASLNPCNASYDFYCSLEVLGPSILSSNVFPSPHLIGAVPGHPIFEKTMDGLAAHWEQMEVDFPGADVPAIRNRVMHRSIAAFDEGVRERIDSPSFRDIVFQAGEWDTHLHAQSWLELETDFEKKIEERLNVVEAKANKFVWALMVFPLLLLILIRKPKILALLLLAAAPLAASDFEQLMGKETEHWKYIQQTEDKELLQKFKTLYEKNRPLLDAAVENYKIPKVVHFIWLGPRPFPPGSVENIRTWIAHHPDWVFKFWTDRDRPVPCNGMEKHYVKDFPFAFLKDCYEDSENFGEKSDVLRFEILYREGGVYADHDANCLQSFEKLNQAYDLYCCLETPHPAFVGRTITSGNGLLGSRPGHPVIKKTIDVIGDRWMDLKNTFRGRDRPTRNELVMQRTYIALTHALNREAGREGNADIVLPSSYFFAKSGMKSLYSKHFYASAWQDNKASRESTEKKLLKHFREIQKKLDQTLWVFIGLSIITVSYVAYRSRTSRS